MSEPDGYELSQIREMANALIEVAEKELNRISAMGIPRLVLGRKFDMFDPWTKEDLEQTFRKALSGDTAAESRLLNSAATSDDAASRYVTWLYALLFWFRENPAHLDEVDNVLRFGRERGITTPIPEVMPRESYPSAPSAVPSTEGYLL